MDTSGKRYFPSIKFPYHLVKPIANFLKIQVKRLEKRKKNIIKDDPFINIDRGEDKAAPDTEVTDRVRHETLNAIKEQIDRRLVQIRKSLTMIKIGKYGNCESCGRMIDTDRLMVFPEATMCLECEKKIEKNKNPKR